MTKEEKAWRKFLKKWEGQRPAKEVLPLMDKERNYYDENGEGLTEYGFLPDRFNNWTDEDLEEYFDSCWVRIYSPYDCTGKLFTCGIDWHRNPCGRISYQHHLALDI